jgi:prophage regulatory protein
MGSDGDARQLIRGQMQNPAHKLLRLTQVKSVTGLSKSTIYARIAEGTFPKQIPLGPRLVVWVESDIQNWIAEQVSAARA